MGQIKIFALVQTLEGRRESISHAIHSAMMEVLGLPESKRFHRFFPMQKKDFLFPNDRSAQYTIIEISLFEGRSIETKKALIRQRFSNFECNVGISSQDLEITITETPMANWGIRGMPGDELQLNYKVESSK